MSTTVESSSSPADLYATLGQSSAEAKAKADDAGSAERFLKLLVTQLQNQDPLNPLDNAQVTSQIAQINTVTGLEKVNQSVQGLGSQLRHSQLLQGAALVGREVSLAGDRLLLDAGVGRGAIELASAARGVRVEIVDAAERVVDTLDLGTLDAGRHAVEWDASAHAGGGPYGFRVAADASGKAPLARTLVVDRVRAVSAAGNELALTLAQLGTVAATDVISFN